jgi:hypothetical protein
MDLTDIMLSGEKANFQKSLTGSNYITFLKWQNNTDSEQVSSHQGLGMMGGRGVGMAMKG